MHSIWVKLALRFSVPKDIILYIHDIVEKINEEEIKVGKKVHRYKMWEIKKQIWNGVDFPVCSERKRFDGLRIPVEKGRMEKNDGVYSGFYYTWNWNTSGRETIDEEVSKLYFVNEDGVRQHK